MSPTLRELKTERLMRSCQRSLMVFARCVFPGEFLGGDHLEKLSAALEGVERGEIKRLMIFMPPRHGKSTLASQLFPVWFMGRHPEAEIIQAGYSDNIAEFHARQARNIFCSRRYAEVFPGVARPLGADDIRRQSVSEFRTLQGGGYRASGITSAISGRGADLIVVDDPHKNRQEANSPSIRASVLSEFRATLTTRLTPDGAIVICSTRWHRDDLAGTLLQEAEGGGTAWTVLNMPAIGQDGNALWPEQWPLEKLQAKKLELGSSEFGVLYQQDPRSLEGAIFRRDWLAEIVAEAPSDCRFCRFWDLAATATLGSNDPDFTAGALVGRTPAGEWFIKNIMRLRGTPLAVESLIRQTAELDGRAVIIRMEQEPGASGKSIVDHYARNVLCGYPFLGVRPLKNKVERAAPVSTAAESGHLKLVRGPWLAPFIDQAEVFPFGTHDDQVDAVSGAFNALAAPRQIRFWSFMPGSEPED